MRDAKDFWTQVREDARANGGSKEWGARAMFAYRLGRWQHKLRPSMLRRACGLLYRLLYRRARNGYGIDLRDGALIGARLDVHQGGISVHRKVAIGDDCVLRQGVFVWADPHDDDSAPVLGDRVDVGAGAAIIGRVRIGSDVTIGPNVVVTVDIPDGATVLTAPARIITPPIRPTVATGTSRVPSEMSAAPTDGSSAT